MKLISLHIENFGCLSCYNLEFTPGLTVVREPNGFGKTTLAEFIRAMFYGFPRVGKTLEKSKRKKYTPWNGGSFGGSLTFSVDDHSYRVERTFGITPRGDSFRLIDLSTGKQSRRFGENLGLELFGVDGESFERSTYFPQNRELRSLSTDSIRAKLGNLVDDTNDVNNFEKAMNTLRGRRAELIPYRGSGGTVAQTRLRISELQQKQTALEADREQMEELNRQCREIEADLRQGTARQAFLQQQSRKAAAVEKAQIIRHYYQQMLQKNRELFEERRELMDRYPGGMPSRQDLEQALQAAEQIELPDTPNRETAEERNARVLIEGDRLRFPSGMPQPRQLEGIRAQYRDILTLRAAISGSRIPLERQKQYQELSNRFAPGIPSDEVLESLSEDARQLFYLQTATVQRMLSREQEEELHKLEDDYGGTLPEEEEIRKYDRILFQAEKLRHINRTSPGKKKTGSVPVLAAAGAAALAAGLLLAVIQKFFPAMLCILAGAAAVIAGMAMAGRNGFSAKHPRNRGDSAEERQAENMEQQVQKFLEFYCCSDSLLDGMERIGHDSAVYWQLRQRKEEEEQLRSQYASQTELLQGKLIRFLEQYQMDIRQPDRALTELKLQKAAYLRLKADFEAGEQAAMNQNQKIQAAEKEITAFLERYGAGNAGEDVEARLDALQKAVDDHVHAVQCLNDRRREKSDWNEKLQDYHRILKDFCRKYNLSDVSRESLRKVETDAARIQFLQESLDSQTKDLQQYRENNDSFFSQTELSMDIDGLEAEAQQLDRQLNDARGLLARRQQQRDRLRRDTDCLPEVRDELEQLEAKKQEEQEKSRILDQTMDFLQEAKEKLSGSYMGEIRKHFAGYLIRLTGESRNGALVSTDLEVQLERGGQAREMGYFSAGQTDLVMLCMRFALVDALFQKENPIVILDDPFVNLDDRRIEQALVLIREMARQRQILYLVCNSSRI